MAQASDPKRWVDAASDAPPEIAALLRQAQRDLPRSSELDSLARRLEPQFAAVAPASELGPTRLGSAPRIGRILGLLAFAGVASVVAVRAFLPSKELPIAPSPAKSSVPTLAPPAIERLAPLPPLPVTPSSVPEAPSAMGSVPLPAPSAPRTSLHSQLGEAELLERARRSLSGSPNQALALTRLHQARFPKGALKQEREVIAIEALRRLGRANDAEQRAGTFEKQYPDSAHRRAVETGLGK